MKMFRNIRFILQQEIGAAAHDDAAGFPGQIQNDVFLNIKDHILDVLFVGAQGKHVGEEVVVGAFLCVADLGRPAGLTAFATSSTISRS